MLQIELQVRNSQNKFIRKAIVGANESRPKCENDIAKLRIGFEFAGYDLVQDYWWARNSNVDFETHEWRIIG
jgi:hypothetical protein